jgi:putative two-component system response regulator
MRSETGSAWMTELNQKSVILAVDDTPENLDVVKGALGGNYVVKAAINGMIALKIAQKVPPDLVLLDIRMPGMDGFEVMEELRANEATQGIPVIFLTGDSDSEVRQRAQDMGAVGFVTKPIDGDILRQSVATALTV